MPKPKVGFYWCASCGGCEESLVDLAEGILAVADLVEIRLWPVAMDFKRADVEAMADGEMLVAMINGAVRTSEQEEMAHLLRKKSQFVIAYGSCACTGGIPALSNQFSRDQVLRYVYHEAATVTNPAGVEPLTEFHDGTRTVTLPEFRNVVRTLDQVVEVDYYMPGCAPNPQLVLDALGALLGGKAPPKGSVLAPDVALCDTCPLIDTKPDDLSIPAFKRPHLHKIDPEVCLLAQGFLCLGPGTRSGCGERCIRGHMPCTGCFGPVGAVRDHGAKLLSALASLVAAEEPSGIEAAIEAIPDPVGTFYRYSLASSMLRRRVDLENGHKEADHA